MIQYSGLDEKSKEEVASFVGEEKYNNSYKKRWEAMVKRNNSILSWNWSAFLVNSLWVAYRKMFAIAYGYLGVYFVLNVLCGLLFDNLNISTVLDVAVWIGFPIFANIVYQQHVFKQVQKLKSVEDVQERHKQLEKKGGTSWGHMFLFLLASIAVEVVLYILFPQG